MYKSMNVLLFSLLLTACSSLPNALVSTNDNVISDYSQWLQTPLDQKSEVRLGGVIAQVTNLQDKTRIEVVNMPISDVGKPNLKVEPEGRFVAYVDGYLDPVTFSEGRLISLLGTSHGEETGQVGDYELTYRVMDATGYHLWTIQETVVIPHTESHLSTCRGMYCRSYLNGSHYQSRGRIVQEVK